MKIIFVWITLSLIYFNYQAYKSYGRGEKRGAEE